MEESPEFVVHERQEPHPTFSPWPPLRWADLPHRLPLGGRVEDCSWVNLQALNSRGSIPSVALFHELVQLTFGSGRAGGWEEGPSSTSPSSGATATALLIEVTVPDNAGHVIAEVLHPCARIVCDSCCDDSM